MSFYLKPMVGNSFKGSVGNSHAEFGTMVPGKLYRFATTVDTWVQQGDTPTATAGDGSEIVPAGRYAYYHGSDGAKLSVLKASSGTGDCSLQEVDLIR